MAGVSICPVCSAPSDDGRIMCGACGADLSVRRLPKHAPGTMPTPTQPVDTSTGSVSVEMCRGPRCGAPVPAGADRCPYCQLPVGRWTISHAGHTVEMPTEGSLDLGRHASATAALFADAENVSRCHATLAVRDGTPEIVDRDSSNGTFVNGVRLQPGVPCRLRPSDELRLAIDVVIEVAQR